MPSTFELASAFKIQKLMRMKTIRAEKDRLGFQLFPLQETDADTLRYVREANIVGLQGARAVNGPYAMVPERNAIETLAQPGYYTDKKVINEAALVARRQIDSIEFFETHGDLIGRITDELTERSRDRKEKNIFDLLLTGGYDVVTPTGTVTHRNYYDIAKLVPSVLFSDLVNSTPIAFLRQSIVNLQLGVSVDFRKGMFVMNGNTEEMILRNQNLTDFGKYRVEGGNTINSLSQFSSLNLDRGLPKFVVYDANYYPESGKGAKGTALRMIPDGRIILIGLRTDGEPAGSYKLTRAAQNGTATQSAVPGDYYQVADFRGGEQGQVPRVEIIAGHNGGPVAEYPEAMAVFNVF